MNLPPEFERASKKLEEGLGYIRQAESLSKSGKPEEAKKALQIICRTRHDLAELPSCF